MLNGWGEMIAAFALFFLSHSIPVRPAIKQRITGLIGKRGFTLAYSALSIAVLAWIIAAAGRAPHVELWPWAPWQNMVPIVAMALAFTITALSLGRPNPLSFGGLNNERFDPAHPGLIGWIRHPLLFALLLWALAHLVPNGDLAHVILFGLFAGFALLGMKIVDRRKQRLLGAQEWQRLASARREIRPTPGGLLRLALGLLAYAAFLHAHQWLFGVSPLT